jgi:D-alanine-D-alanine ligase
MESSHNIIVLNGGNSSEREISLISGNEVFNTLKNIYKDIYLIDTSDFKSCSELINFLKKINNPIIVNMLHGGFGENGHLQSLLEMEKIPFTGSGAKASMIAMDKYISGILVNSIGIPTPKKKIFFDFKKSDLKIIDEFGGKIVVKPIDAGSSVGIHIVDDKNKFLFAVKDAFKYSKNIIVEKFIDGRELTVTILEGKAKPVIEIKPKSGWYDFTNKYSKGNTEYIAPAALSENEKTTIQSYAEKIFKIIDCYAYARVDFRYDGQYFYFLEINTLPGMTPLSLTPMSAKESGMEFIDLLNLLITLAIKRS